MHLKKRYNEILFILDTCQASTLANYIDAPNITFVGSSMKNENSYAYDVNTELGLSVIDRFSHSLIDFFSKRFSKVHHFSEKYESSTTLQNLINSMTNFFLLSTVHVMTTKKNKDLRFVNLLDFFRSISDAKTVSSNKSNTTVCGTATELVSNKSSYNSNDASTSFLLTDMDIVYNMNNDAFLLNSINNKHDVCTSTKSNDDWCITRSVVANNMTFMEMVAFTFFMVIVCYAMSRKYL